MESLPAEIIYQIYELSGKYSNNLRKVSKYLFYCYPGNIHMHKIAYDECLKDIRATEYQIIDFSVTDIADSVGICLFTGSNFTFSVFTETYSLRKLKTKITAAKYRSHHMEDFGVAVFDEICIITNKQMSFRNFNGVGDEFEESVKEMVGYADGQLFKYCKIYCERHYSSRDGEIVVNYFDNNSV